MANKLTRTEWLKLQRFLDQREEARWEEEREESINDIKFKNELERSFWNDRE